MTLLKRIRYTHNVHNQKTYFFFYVNAFLNANLQRPSDDLVCNSRIIQQYKRIEKIVVIPGRLWNNVNCLLSIPAKVDKQNYSNEGYNNPFSINPTSGYHIIQSIVTAS